MFLNYTTCLCSLFLTSTAHCSEHQLGFSIGETAEKYDIFSLLYRIETTDKLESFGIPLERFKLRSYQDFTIFQLKDSGERIHGASTMVTLSREFESLQFASFTPALEVSTGVAFLADVEIGLLDFGSSFQFQHQASAVLKRNNFDLFFSAGHISNGGITPPNDGADIISLGFRFKF